MRISLWAILFGLLLSPVRVAALTRPAFDVLCDSSVGIHSCHEAHPQGAVLSFPELQEKVRRFPSGRMTVLLTSGDRIQSRDFKVLDAAFLVGKDTVEPKEIRYFILNATWPDWHTVGQLALGGAMMFGSFGLIVDGIQWVGGSGGDLGATSGGAVFGAALFGGLGILLARDRYEVMIQQGLDQRMVWSDPDDENAAVAAQIAVPLPEDSNAPSAPFSIVATMNSAR